MLALSVFALKSVRRKPFGAGKSVGRKPFGAGKLVGPKPSGASAAGVARRWRPIVGVLLVSIALAAAGCGSSSSKSSASSAAASPTAASTNTTPAGTSSSTTTTTHLAKTKFVLHAGLAFGAFHRWIYKPLKAGELKHPLSHKAATVKAALAAAFTYHELKLALADAQSDPTLSHLVAPITALQDKIHGLGSGLKSGQVNSAQVDDANGSIDSIHSGAAAAGQPITEQTPASP